MNYITFVLCASINNNYITRWCSHPRVVHRCIKNTLHSAAAEEIVKNYITFLDPGGINYVIIVGPTVINNVYIWSKSPPPGKRYLPFLVIPRNLNPEKGRCSVCLPDPFSREASLLQIQCQCLSGTESAISESRIE